jgi:tetratricopeptide (TPR) repeat protein
MKRLLSSLSTIFGRSQAQSKVVPVAPVSDMDTHNLYYRKGGELIEPYMRIHDLPERRTDSVDARRDITQGILLLEAVVAYNPMNWNAMWIIGKGYQAMGADEQACDAFARSFAIERRNPDVAREYMFECLNLGRIDEGVSAAQHAVGLVPRDAGLLANLALAYTIAGRISDARSVIDESLRIDPDDAITRSLQQTIEAIASGQMRQPRTLGELEGR